MKPPTIDNDVEEVLVAIESSTGKKIAQVKLPDGRVLPIKSRPKPRKPKTGPSAGFSANAEARMQLIINNTSSYRVLDSMRLGTGEMGGSPGIYPRQLFSLMFVLQNASTQKAMCQNLRFPHHLRAIQEQLSILLPDVQPDDQARIRKWLVNPRIPSASHLSRTLNQLFDRGVDLEEFLLNQGNKLAIQHGRYSRDSDVYSQKNFLVGDGTVLKSASSKPPMEYIDIDTGEIRQRRTDFGALLHTEGGGETVHGSKFLPMWTVGEDQHDTICMGVTHVASVAPAIEAQCSVELVSKIQDRLVEQNSCATLLSYDRAAGHKEQEALNNIGIVVGTRAFVDIDESSESHYRKPKYIGHATASCGHDQRFVSILKRLHHEVKDVNGKTVHKMLEHRLRPKRRGSRVFHYSEHPYACWCSPDTIQTLRISWNGRKAALGSSKSGITLSGDSGYENMLRYLQPHAPGTADFEIVHGKRQTSESMHSIIDGYLTFKRLARWSLEAKKTWIHGYLIGHNLAFEQLRRTGTIQALTG